MVLEDRQVWQMQRWRLDRHGLKHVLARYVESSRKPDPPLAEATGAANDSDPGMERAGPFGSYPGWTLRLDRRSSSARHAST